MADEPDTGIYTSSGDVNCDICNDDEMEEAINIEAEPMLIQLCKDCAIYVGNLGRMIA